MIASNFNIDYYPFGMPMPGRTYQAPLTLSGYRFGFNVQSKDNEIYGAGNLNTALFWEYDTRLGRRWNQDPIFKESESPFSCFNGNPILIKDEKGDDGKSAAAVEVITQEAAAAAASSVVFAPAVPFIEAVGNAIALWELFDDVPVVIPPIPVIIDKQKPILHNNAEGKNVAQQNREENTAKGIPESQLGPSGKPKIHSVEKPTQKRAKDAARNNEKSNSSPEKNTKDKGQQGHYHSTKDGVKLKGKDNVHYTYPSKVNSQ